MRSYIYVIVAFFFVSCFTPKQKPDITSSKSDELSQELTSGSTENKEVALTKEQYLVELSNRISTLQEMKTNYFSLHKQMYNYVMEMEGCYLFQNSEICQTPVNQKALEIRLTKNNCSEASRSSVYDELYRLENVFSGIPSKKVQPYKDGMRFKEFEYQSFLVLSERGDYTSSYSIETNDFYEEGDTIPTWIVVKNFKVIPGKLSERINDLKQIGVSQGKKSKGYKNHQKKIANLIKNIKSTRDGLPMIRSQITDIDLAIKEAELNKTMVNLKDTRMLKSLDKVIKESQSKYFNFIENLRS